MQNIQIHIQLIVIEYSLCTRCRILFTASCYFRGDRPRGWGLFLSPGNKWGFRCFSGFPVSLLVSPLPKIILVVPLWIKFSGLCVTDKIFCDLLVSFPTIPLPLFFMSQQDWTLIVLGKFYPPLWLFVFAHAISTNRLPFTTHSIPLL